MLLLNAVTFVISGALLLAFSRVPRHAPPSPDGEAGGSRAWLRALASSARAAASQTPLLRMIIFSLPVASIALGIVIAASVPTLRDTYGASNLQTGVIMALDALGIAIGTSLPGALRGLSQRAWRCSRSAGAASASRPICWIAGPLSIIGGIGNGIVIVRFRTMMQRETPPHERASTIGFAYAVTFSMIVVGQIAVVPLSNALGQRATFTAAGTIFALGGLRRGAVLAEHGVAAPAPARLEVASEASPVHAR